MYEEAEAGERDAITDVPGILTGHAHDERVRSGVSVVMGERSLLCAAEVRGGAPGTREVDALEPSGLVGGKVEGVFLAGGSVYGLATGDAMAAWLGERGRGFRFGKGTAPPAPVAPGAILYDLANGGDKDWGMEPPYRRLGLEACEALGRGEERGLAGAGYGAIAGGGGGGLGTASYKTRGGVYVGALSAVNAFGSVVEGGEEPLDFMGMTKAAGRGGGLNTTISVVAMNVALSATELKRAAVMAQDGVARATWPSHTPYDGDATFALSTGELEATGDRVRHVLMLGSMCAHALSRAIRGVGAKASGGVGLVRADFRPVLGLLGLFAATLGLLMIIPGIVNEWTGSSGGSFFLWGLIWMFAGMTVYVGMRAKWESASLRQALALVVGLWATAPLVAATPLSLYAGLDVTYTDAFFEATSGITTTGATVMERLEERPRGVLIWRAMLQWIGGVGVVVMAIAALPLLRVGGMELFRLDRPSSLVKEVRPRTRDAALGVSAAYIAMTLGCVFAYKLSGMGWFDATAHAMTTTSTGGFSTYDQSLGVFDSASVEFSATIFMILGSLPFASLLLFGEGKIRRGAQDSQIWWFFVIVAGFVFALWCTRMLSGAGAWESFRGALFNGTSVLTGTGYASVDYGVWGAFAGGLFFAAMFVGGCAGSTSCGVKTFRVVVAARRLTREFRSVGFTHRVTPFLYNGRPMSDKAVASVFNFLLAYFLCFGLFSVAASALGDTDALTTLSAVAASLANVGPGLGEVGPASSYAGLTDAVKWLLSVAMFVGRVEVFPALALLWPSFWRD